MRARGAEAGREGAPALRVHGMSPRSKLMTREVEAASRRSKAESPALKPTSQMVIGPILVGIGPVLVRALLAVGPCPWACSREQTSLNRNLVFTPS